MGNTPKGKKSSYYNRVYIFIQFMYNKMTILQSGLCLSDPGVFSGLYNLVPHRPKMPLTCVVYVCRDISLPKVHRGSRGD